MLKLIIITISIGLASTTVYNYCSHNLCSLTEYKHITCTATGDLSPSCSSNAQIIDLTGADKRKILDLHNRYRNRIANGDESGFSSAAKMATLVSIDWFTSRSRKIMSVLEFPYRNGTTTLLTTLASTFVAVEMNTIATTLQKWNIQVRISSLKPKLMSLNVTFHPLSIPLSNLGGMNELLPHKTTSTHAVVHLERSHIS